MTEGSPGFGNDGAFNMPYSFSPDVNELTPSCGKVS